jgi:hypothetical protein
MKKIQERLQELQKEYNRIHESMGYMYTCYGSEIVNDEMAIVEANKALNAIYSQMEILFKKRDEVAANAI